MEKLLLSLLVENLPSAIAFTVIALVPLTVLTVWRGTRMLLIAVAFVCVNVGLWGGIIVLLDALWHGGLPGSELLLLTACAASIGAGLWAMNAAERRQGREISQLTAAPAILSVFWLLFFGAFAGERWKDIYDDLWEDRQSHSESWPDALRAARASTKSHWNKQFPEARVENLLAFGDPEHTPQEVVVWAVVPGPATDTLPILVHHAAALVDDLHRWQRKEGFPCRSDFGVVSAGTLQAVGTQEFFGEDGRRTRPQATYDNRFNFYAARDSTEQGPRCEFVEPRSRGG